MSERIPQKHEQGESLLPEGKVEQLLEAHYERSEAEQKAEAALQQAKLETARDVAETVERDDPLARLQAAETKAADQAPAPPPDKFLQKQTLKRELKSIQNKESAPVRSLSKFIHQPGVQAASEVAGKTISRPSGLLGGGIAAFVGTSLYLFLAYYIGFTYEPSVFLFLLAFGFAAGVAVELALRAFSRSKS